MAAHALYQGPGIGRLGNESRQCSWIEDLVQRRLRWYLRIVFDRWRTRVLRQCIRLRRRCPSQEIPGPTPKLLSASRDAIRLSAWKLQSPPETLIDFAKSRRQSVMDIATSLSLVLLHYLR